MALFGSQTLKHKLVYDWRQLDESAALGLRERLWSLLFTSPGPLAKNVAVQLRLALAALIVQMEPSLWPDPVGDLFRFLATSSSSPASSESVLELLTVIPEQLRNPAIRFASTDAYYERCERLLEKHIDQVIQMLLSRLGPDAEEETLATTLSCLLSWIQYGGNGSKLIESPQFLQGIFGLLKRECLRVDGEDDEDSVAVIETCSELLIELSVRMSGRIDDDYGDETGEGSRDDRWFASLTSNWIPTLADELSSIPFPVVLRRPVLQRPIVSLLSEACQLFLDPLLQEHSLQFSVIVEGLLAVVEQCATGVVELSFGFWGALPDALSTWDHTDRDTQMEPFLPVYSRLFCGLLGRHLPFPAPDQHCTPEAIDLFRELRHLIGDVLKDCVRVLGASETLLLVLPALKAGWRDREAALFALRTISSVIDPRESEVMPTIVSELSASLRELLSMAQLPGVRKPVSGIVLNVGCYAEWLRYHADHLPQFLEMLSSSLQYALGCQSSGLEAPQTIISSALQSLKYVAESVGGQLGRHYSSLEGLYTACFTSPLLSNRDRLDLTEALCLVLVRRAGAPVDEASLQVLLQPIWQLGRWDAYAVALETLLVPEMPTQTLFIFQTAFLPVLPQLLAALQEYSSANSQEEEAFGEAWLRCFQAALNNGTPGAVDEMIKSVVFPWMRVLDMTSLSASRQASLFALHASLISGQLVNPNDTHYDSIIRSHLHSSNTGAANCESWCVERFNLLRVVIIYGNRSMPFLREIGGVELLSILLGESRRAWSSGEIVALSGFLTALLGSSVEAGDWATLEGILARVCELGLAEWPLSSSHDLAVLMGRAGRIEGFPLVRLFEGLLQRLLPPGSTSQREQEKLVEEFQGAVRESLRAGRSKMMRQLMRELAESIRRRRTT